MRTLLFILFVVAAVALPARADDPFRDGEKTFLKARELLQKQYVDDKVADDRMWRAATEGLFHGVGNGKWDKLLSPSELAALKADLAGEVVGLGVGISTDDVAGIINIDGVVPGSAAERAGLQVGDKILKLDGKSVKGLSQSEAARSIRGKAGTTVTLTILRDAEIVNKTIKRAPFVIDPVRQTMLPGGLALLEVRMFTDKTPKMFRTALEKLRGSARGLIIDLRSNEGGKYDTMLECANQLLPKNSPVVTELRRGGATVEKRTWSDPLTTVPIVVLVDHETASGAEILAAALKQSGARVVGKRTFGKWNAQELVDLGNGWGAKYTTVVFRAPSGALPDGHGIDPDVEVELGERDFVHASAQHDPEKRIALDAQLRVAVNLLKMK
jgi:carboxyl-terminal processing protease